MHYLFNCDALPAEIADHVQACSFAFSHFFLWRPGNLLLDCGEGTAIRLDTHVFRADVLALSHGHFDHCRGMAGLLQTRAGLPGSARRALRVLYPAGSSSLEPHLAELREMIAGSQGFLEPVEFQPLEPGRSVPLRNNLVLDACGVPHIPGEDCFAWRVRRISRCLRDEYRGLSSHTIRELRAERGDEAVLEKRFETLLVYSGDTPRIDPEFARGARLLIHEATFMNEDGHDHVRGTHATVASALRTARDAGVQNVMLFHMSRRYDGDELCRIVQLWIDRLEVTCPVVAIRGSLNLPTD